MSVKRSIMLTPAQDAFARSLVESGRYSSMSAVVQHALELLHQKNDAETADTEAIRKLLRHRLGSATISVTEMESRVSAMIERKRRDV